VIFYVAMIPFFFFGIYAAIRRMNVPALLMAAFFGYFVVYHTVLAAMIRYRIPVMPLFFILSAFGLIAGIAGKEGAEID